MDDAAAERTIRTTHGVAYLSEGLPRVWYRNFLRVDPDVDASASELALEAEAVFAPARLQHRKIDVEHELGARLAPGFRRRGWTVHEYLVMTLPGEVEPVDLSGTVEVDAEQLVPVWRRGIRQWHPDDTTVRQLIEAQLERRNAVDVRYFAALAEDRIAAYCELFSADGVGQVESVMCLEKYRGRGLGKAVTARAAAESVAAGHDLTFLVADAEDWPKELYRRLGFRDTGGRTWDFVREPARS
jgi:ribosomal protein S18 acetylase RimI-like enzyme